MGLRDCAPEQSHPFLAETMEYRCVAASPDGFVSQVVRYVSSGHVFYFTGQVPGGRDPAELDQKLIGLYGVSVPAWTRSRRRSRGLSSVHYLRFERHFILMASAGRGPFFEHLGERRIPDGTVVTPRQFRDIRRESLEFDAYAIRFTACMASSRPGRVPARRVLVRLNRSTYRDLKHYFREQATRYPRANLEAMVWSLGFYPYRPVGEQLWAIVRMINRTRRQLGLEELDGRRCVRRRKPPLRVFDESRLKA